MKRLTATETADRLGLTDRQVRNLGRDGVIPTHAAKNKVTYPWPESRDKYWAWKLDEELKRRAPIGAEEVAALKQRKLDAETRLAEAQAGEAEGRLILLTLHEKRVATLCDRLRSVLMNIPSKYLGRIQQTRTDADAQAVGEAIRDETFRALMELTDDSEMDDVDVTEPDPAGTDADAG